MMTTLRPGTAPGRRAALAMAVLGGLVAGSAARAAGPAIDETPVTARAQNACFSDNVRVTGWLLPRGETAVSASLDGYRISDVLVREGDVVAGDQEVVRLARLGDAAPGPGGRPLPATLSLKAPAPGIVSKVTARVGALSGPATEPVVRLVTDPDTELLVEVPSVHAGRIRRGATARVLFDDGTEAAGTVRQPAADVDPATQFARARLSVRTDKTLRFGTFARALIDTGQSCGVAVPRSAILRQNDATGVQVMRDGRMEVRRVRTGLSSEDMIEVREGLAEGEMVVVNAGLAY